MGSSLLYHWPSVGWCVGVIKEANGDRRRKIDGDHCGKLYCLTCYYEIDDDTSMHVLTLNAYGGEDIGSWVLLEPIEEAR